MRSSLFLYLFLCFFLFSCHLFKKSSKVTNDNQSSQSNYLDSVAEAEFGSGSAVTEQYDYRPSHTKKNDLLHTVLRLRFDYAKQHVMGSASLSFKPYFYPVTSLELDAKGFDIHKVQMETAKGKDSLSYDYDGSVLTIRLGRTYTSNETYRVYIEYTAKPEEAPMGFGQAITGEKGLYFINPTGKEPHKPRQIWTQGETQSNSRWFPTIDAPNEKMTQEFYLTVDSADVTLSNGELVYSNKNTDGTRTDCWKQNLPHAPYLAMIAVGNFKIVKDDWRDSVDVNYYVEPAYERNAKMIFGNTPEMIEFFSRRLGVDYVWPKYSQIVVRDFVSGAMENTSAVVFFNRMQHDAREHLDETYENIISHELFHHWFGDLVTAESWSNLTLNESFATYGEYLWNEHKYGRDEADHGLQDDFSAYLNAWNGESAQKPAIINYHYANEEKMFNAYAYQKGGRVLHMLRKYVGDTAFFKALNQYLLRHKFGTAELSDLRKEFEEITGEDLNWFFNQWFLNSGHPELDIFSSYDEDRKELSLTVTQTQGSDRPFILPVDVDIYLKDTVLRKRIIVNEKEQLFAWTLPVKPELVNFDAEKMLLGTKYVVMEKEECAYKYLHAPLYEDRYEALINMNVAMADDSLRLFIFRQALQDNYWAIRQTAIEMSLDFADSTFGLFRSRMETMALNDPRSAVRATALQALTRFRNENTKNILLKAVNDSSYLVISTAITSLSIVAPEEALRVARQMEHSKNSGLLGSIATLLANAGDRSDAAFFGPAIINADDDHRPDLVTYYGDYLARMPADVIMEGLGTMQKIYTEFRDSETRIQVIGTLMQLGSANTEKIETIRSKNLQPGDPGQKEADTELLLLNMLESELHTAISNMRGMD